MRVTVHLDSFDRINPSAYAIVWFDKAAGKWSREGHAGITLPEWGHFDCANGSTQMSVASDAPPLCVLEGLDFGAVSGPFEGEEGRTDWLADARSAHAEGRWHVQWIDETTADPEYGLFADDNA